MRAASDTRHIFVIDDDPAVLRSVQSLLEGNGYAVTCFGSPEMFLAKVSTEVVGCVMADLKLPGVSGSQFQRRVATDYPGLSVIISSSRPDVATAVQVMQNGAVTLLEKPYVPRILIAAVDKALEQSQQKSEAAQAEIAVRSRLATLTDDERQVTRLMIQGYPNKRIVMELQLSPRTVDRRRAAVLSKMGVTSVPELAALMSRITDW